MNHDDGHLLLLLPGDDLSFAVLGQCNSHLPGEFHHVISGTTVMSSCLLSTAGLLPLFLHTASDQKLEA